MAGSPAVTRRALLHGAGLGVLAFNVAGSLVWLTPAEARSRDVPLRVLTTQEAVTLAAFGEVLLPGAAAAGIVHFVDHQLAVDPADCLLMIRYLDVAAPYSEFYKAGLAALESASRRYMQRQFAALEPAEAAELVARISREPASDWQGPPSPYFYFVVRSDAVDVVYGTPEGFEKLGIPYMAHIMPPTRW